MKKMTLRIGMDINGIQKRNLLEDGFYSVLGELEFKEHSEDTNKDEGPWGPHHWPVRVTLHYLCDFKHLNRKILMKSKINVPLSPWFHKPK